MFLLSEQYWFVIHALIPHVWFLSLTPTYGSTQCTLERKKHKLLMRTLTFMIVPPEKMLFITVVLLLTSPS